MLNAHRRIYEGIRERNPEKAGKEKAHHVREEEKDLFEIQRQFQ